MEVITQPSIEDEYEARFDTLVEFFRYAIINEALDEDYTNDEIKEALSEALKEYKD